MIRSPSPPWSIDSFITPRSSCSSGDSYRLKGKGKEVLQPEGAS